MWITQKGGATLPAGEKTQLFRIYDYADIKRHNDGDQWSYEWKNSHPMWLGVGGQMAFPFGSITGPAADRAATFNKFGWFAGTRSDWLIQFYWQEVQYPQFGATGAPGEGMAYATTTKPTVDPQTVSCVSAATDTPPYAYFKMNPLYGPNNAINIVSAFLCTYTMTLELEHLDWFRNQIYDANGMHEISNNDQQIYARSIYNQRNTLGDNRVQYGRKRRSDDDISDWEYLHSSSSGGDSVSSKHS